MSDESSHPTSMLVPYSWAGAHSLLLRLSSISPHSVPSRTHCVPPILIPNPLAWYRGRVAQPHLMMLGFNFPGGKRGAKGQ